MIKDNSKLYNRASYLIFVVLGDGGNVLILRVPKVIKLINLCWIWFLFFCVNSTIWVTFTWDKPYPNIIIMKYNIIIIIIITLLMNPIEESWWCEKWFKVQTTARCILIKTVRWGLFYSARMDGEEQVFKEKSSRK